jgi:hypothetical protein
MTDQPAEEPLDFQRAQFDAPPPAAACKRCQRALSSSYFSVNGQGVCAACLELAQKEQRSSFSKALLLGTGAGTLGALVYYGIRTVTGYDLALITIVVGVAVGIGVRMGAGGSKSMGYRVLAVALTWIAMCSTYVPTILGSLEEDAERHSPIAIVIALLFSLVTPVFFITEGEVLALLIFAFGLWEAFRLSAPRPFVVEGPFDPQQAQPVAAAPAPSDATPPPVV